MTQTHGNIPLRSLQIFETAARCGSFTAAGEELGITQSGVSRQVSDLEATLGMTLFVRNGPRLGRTPAGERLAAQLTDAFSRVWGAVADATRSDQVVTLSMLPSVATRWFAPRLGAFLSAHPDIDLRITASRHLVNFAAEGVDAAIRYSPGPSPGLVAIKLGTETIQPVCSPDYARSLALNSPDDLHRATLLCSDLPEDWSTWFAAAGCKHPPQSGPRLGDDAAILQAVVDHQGIALGRSRLVADDLATGKLITPFDVTLAASFGYWFVQPKGAPTTKAIDAVRSWLVDQFAGEN